MITKASFRNFKSLRDVPIDLERFTVFVGPNASGKSSILQGLHHLCRSFCQPSSADNPIQHGTSRGATDGVELAAETAGQWYRYRTASPAAPAGPRKHGQPWSGEGCGVAPELNSAEWNQWTSKQPNQSPLPSSVLLRFEASKLMQPGPGPQEPTVMGADGTGLHPALAHVALSDPESWQILQERLRQLVPTVRRLRLTLKASPNSPSLLFDMQGADSLTADQVSEGTLLVLGLLTALHTSGGPNLVLLDDLDRGLHPKGQRELVGLLRTVLASNPEMQIVATTHSPYLLGRMEPNEVRMTVLDEAGATACDSLTHHPKFPKWKDEFSPGEMWSLFGEKWVVGQEVGV